MTTLARSAYPQATWFRATAPASLRAFPWLRRRRSEGTSCSTARTHRRHFRNAPRKQASGRPQPRWSKSVQRERQAPPGYPRIGSCWSAQRLPKNTSETHGNPVTSLTSTPRPASSTRAACASATTSCRPRAEPGSESTIPVPSAIEHADPGGVSCTKRISSLTVWS
jgi:hypothetical protein